MDNLHVCFISFFSNAFRASRLRVMVRVIYFYDEWPASAVFQPGKRVCFFAVAPERRLVGSLE